jgi:hypothetical protein
MAKGKYKDRDAVYAGTLFGTVLLIASFVVLVEFPQWQGFHFKGTHYPENPTWTGLLVFSIVSYLVAIFAYFSYTNRKKLPGVIWLVAAFNAFALIAALLNPVTRNRPLMPIFPGVMAAAGFFLLKPRRLSRLFAVAVFTINLLYIGAVFAMLVFLAFRSEYAVFPWRTLFFAGYQFLFDGLILYYLTRRELKQVYE